MKRPAGIGISRFHSVQNIRLAEPEPGFSGLGDYRDCYCGDWGSDGMPSDSQLDQDGIGTDVESHK